MTYKDFFVVSADIPPIYYPNENTEFILSDFEKTDPKGYKEQKDKCYLFAFKNHLEREKLSNLKLYDFIDFHYNYTSFKKEFLIMIECDILPNMDTDNTLFEFFYVKPERKKRVEMWLNEKKQEISKPFKSVNPSVFKPLTRHWALFFAYWYHTNDTTFIPVTTAISDFCDRFKPNYKSESIRKKYNDFGFRHASERGKYKKEVEFVINNFLKEYPKNKELAEKDLF